LIDDVKLRQRIQKQLNKIELSHKFSNSIFFANNQAFIQSAKEDQEIAVGCKRLMQNSIVLWNYLRLSQLLIECKDAKEKQALITIIKNGSIMIWAHINMYGEYDFIAYEACNDAFNMVEILQLKVA